jgi:hypothetical protein
MFTPLPIQANGLEGVNRLILFKTTKEVEADESLSQATVDEEQRDA